MTLEAEPDARRTVELLLPADAVAALLRRPGMVRAAPRRAVSLIWHDDPDGSLSASGVALQQDGRTWSLQPIAPEGGIDWPACSPAPLLSEAASPSALDPPAPFDVGPVAAFHGARLSYRLGPIDIDILAGSVRSVSADHPTGRIRLSGPAPALCAAADTLAAAAVGVPRRSLPAEAADTAKGRRPAPRHIGAPVVQGETTVSDGLAAIVGHLLDTLLHWLDEFRREPRPEAVHQARVAIRRLRSALSLYRRALPCPEIDRLAEALRACAASLGAARDWDVFLAGTAADLAASDDDGRIAALLRAASRQRSAAYRALGEDLAGTGFRAVELSAGMAAALRPWERGCDPAVAQSRTADFAAEALQRRLKHVRRRGREVKTLPVAELHELRKDCKRLRYAAEFFADAFASGGSAKTFLKRLSALQEELGLLNDAAAAAGLMTRLGRPGKGYAAGMVAGWTAAAAAPARVRIRRAYRRFKSVSPFWIA